MEQVILAFESEKNALHMRDILESEGLAECLLCHSAAEVKRLAGQQQVAAVICGYKLPDETAESLFEDLSPTCPMLVVALQGMLELIDNRSIFTLSAPATRSRLLSAVRLILQENHRIARYIRPRRPQQERELVERAKSMLMERRGMSEEQAHRFLQKRSMDAGKKLPQTAQEILDGTRSD